MMVWDAARCWGVVGTPRLIKDRENAVYEIAVPGGERAVLRLHRPGYQSLAAITSELWWMTRLADLGLPVPRPIPALDGALVVSQSGRAASVVSWIDGKQSGDGETPLPTDRSTVEAHYESLGGLIARMHDATDKMVLPETFDRAAWDTAAYLGHNPLWGRFWENPALSATERQIMLSARELMADRLSVLQHGKADFGLIHADLLRENVLVDNTRLSIIDFDDCGFGFRAYDLATALVQALGDPMYPVATDAIESGYGEVRRKDAPPLGNVGLFVALRCFASAGWIVSRAGRDDLRMRFYAERAVRAARELLGEP